MSEKNIKLVIAEKTSVAQSIAKVIGADKREDGYLEGNGYIVGFARTGVERRTTSRKVFFLNYGAQKINHIFYCYIWGISMQ